MNKVKAVSCSVARLSKDEASLRFFEQGSANTMGEQTLVMVSWSTAKLIINQLREADPDNYGKARDLPQV